MHGRVREGVHTDRVQHSLEQGSAARGETVGDEAVSGQLPAGGPGSDSKARNVMIR